MGSLIRKSFRQESIPQAASETGKPTDRAGVKLFEDYKFCLAVDLGQSQDPSAICVAQHIRRSLVTYKGLEQPAGDEFHIRYLARLPLGLSYIAQVQEVAKLLRRPPLDAGCPLVVDETGVGRAVCDLFEREGLFPTRVSITSGDRAICHGARSWHIGKSVLISALDARLHAGEIKFSAELAEASAMADELRDFRRSVSAAGRYSYEARVGRHDDLVLSCALAIDHLLRHKKRPVTQVGKYGFTGKRS